MPRASPFQPAQPASPRSVVPPQTLHTVLRVCPRACRPFAEKYLEDQDAFFSDYVESHLKLSELGVEWDGEPVTLPKA